MRRSASTNVPESFTPFGTFGFNPKRPNDRFGFNRYHNKHCQNMKKIAIAILALLAPLAASAQTELMDTNIIIDTNDAPAARQQTGQAPSTLLRYGYVSYNDVLQSMPEIEQAQKSLETLRSKYDVEMKRSEDEFNAKYEEFLEAQRDLVPSILRKRQAELQDMMDKNTAFRAEARRLLAQAESDAYAPLHAKLKAAIGEVAAEQGLAFVLNTDNNACPYINPAMGVDVTSLVRARVGK